MFWYENGQKKYEGKFKDGKRHGLWMIWHANGQKKSEKNYKDDQEVKGSEKFWNSKGEPVDSLEETELDGVNYEEIVTRDGIGFHGGSDTPYTGNVFAFYLNGEREMEGSLKDGKWHGPSILYYKNGQRRIKENWKNGETDGLWVEWYENGQKEKEGNLKKGKVDGLVILWHENGQKKGEVNWANGEIVEVSEKYWNNKGEPVESIEEADK